MHPDFIRYVYAPFCAFVGMPYLAYICYIENMWYVGIFYIAVSLWVVYGYLVDLYKFIMRYKFMTKLIEYNDGIISAIRNEVAKNRAAMLREDQDIINKDPNEIVYTADGEAITWKEGVRRLNAKRRSSEFARLFYGPVEKWAEQ